MIINNLISEILFAFAGTHFISTHIIQVIGINFRGEEYNTGISDDGGKVRINTATSTVKEKTKRVVELGTFISAVTSSEVTRPSLKRMEPS